VLSLFDTIFVATKKKGISDSSVVHSTFCIFCHAGGKPAENCENSVSDVSLTLGDLINSVIALTLLISESTGDSRFELGLVCESKSGNDVDDGAVQLP
jgi:hypothetical protein